MCVPNPKVLDPTAPGSWEFGASPYPGAGPIFYDQSVIVCFRELNIS
jgi:hypothetical protein